jgi:hypothetical protein
MYRLDRFTLALLLLTALGIAACASGDSASDRDREPRVYGGVSGGMSRP